MDANSQTTCWTLIDQAAGGDRDMRGEFSTKYYSVVQKYLSARWGRSRFASFVDDACQEVFVECFRSGGPLERAERGRPGGFRGFLYGVVRNVARRVEQRQYIRMPGTGGEDVLNNVGTDESSLSQVFDRAWAQAIMKEAGDRQAVRAAQAGPDAARRIELLKLRFQDGLPIRDIAVKWNVEAANLHREYSKARKEFLVSLRQVVFEQNDGVSPSEVDQRCVELIEMLR